MAYRRGDDFINKLVDGGVVGVLKPDTNRQDQNHYQQRRDQRGERLLYRGRHPVRHLNHQLLALKPAEQFGPQQRTDHGDE